MVTDLRTSGNVVYTDYGRRCPVPFKTPESAEVERIFCGLPPGIEPYLWSSGRRYFKSGSFVTSEYADAVFTLEHYLFYGDPGINLNALGFGYEDEREWIIRQILSEESDNDQATNWSYRASRCIPNVLEGTETARIKSCLAALTSFLFRVPSHKEAVHIEYVIMQLNEELLIRTLGPLVEE